MNKRDFWYIKDNMFSKGHNSDFKSDNLGFGHIHYAMIRNIRPSNILVIGSQRGFVPAVCGIACRDNGFGVVDFVDAGKGLNDDNSWGGIGLWKRVGQEYWKLLELENIITTHVMKIQDFKTDVKYQYAYVDGDHSYEGVKYDYKFCRRHMDEGYIVFHDVLIDKKNQYGQCGVKKFWNELKGEKIDLPFDFGLGVLQI